jgi:hypothetical protein
VINPLSLATDGFLSKSKKMQSLATDGFLSVFMYIIQIDENLNQSGKSNIKYIDNQTKPTDDEEVILIAVKTFMKIWDF